MKKIDYTYQDIAAREVIANAFNKSYLASVLAAYPGAGKTTISHKILNEYTDLYGDRVVVLAHGQNLLKNQYLSELDNPNIPINFTYGDFESNAQVRVGLPHSIDKIEWNAIDLLIVDEAHEYFFADMVQSIILKLKPKHIILMTGSPSKYNKWNFENPHRQFAMHYISGNELKDKGVYSGVDLDTVIMDTNTYPMLNMKYNEIAIKRSFDKARADGVDLSKIMVACSNIEDAEEVSSVLERYFNRKVSLSTSKNDEDNKQLDAFKDGQTDTLVVVDKGILGFNDHYITFLIDMKGSSNIDRNCQLFARILRTHPQGLRKTYYRVTTDYNHNENALMLYKVVALMDKDNFKNFTGNNLVVEVA